MQDDDQNIEDKHKVTQTNKDGDEVIIKDPIYDVMTDEELDVASQRLLSLIESDEDSEHNVDQAKTPKESN